MKLSALSLALFLITACSTALPPLTTVTSVDLNRFMGPWYVIACIPTAFETDVYNGVETYRRDPDGSIDTVFTFNKGAFDGPPKRYNPRGFVVDTTTNATWGMQFLWPFKAEYLITYLKEDYSQTIISRNRRDYAWIMARTPQMAEPDYQHLVQELKRQGYDTGKLYKVPQRWPNDAGRP